MLVTEFAIAIVLCAAVLAWWMWRERRKFPRESERFGRGYRYHYIFGFDGIVHVGLYLTAGLAAAGMLLMIAWHIPEPPWMFPLFVVPIVVAHLYRIRRRRAVMDDVRRRGYRLCPMCQYSLEGSPPEGRCPECGQTYTREYLTNEWETSFREWRW